MKRSITQKLTAFVKKNFMVIQLDMWGSREVTDLDGKAMEERELARRWRVNFTPTIVFLPTPEEIKAGATEVARMPGYFKPFHFIGALKFVAENRHNDLPFQRYLQEVAREMQAQGIKVELW